MRPDTSFGLISLVSEPAAVLASRIETSPRIDFSVETKSPEQAVLRPATRLTAGQDYRFSLRGATGELQGSWTFTVRGPLRVLSTIPATHSTQVPVDRAVEFTFDQLGAADISPYFSITPKVTGRFERHGATQVFIPDRLEAATVYTARLRAGLPRTGTDLVLERDVVVAFETASGASGDLSQPLVVGRDAVEWAPGTPPVLAVAVHVPENSVPTSVEVVVRRFADEASAARAFASFLAAGRWAAYTRPALTADGLQEVARFTGALETGAQSGYRTLRFPAALPLGWYAVELKGTPASSTFLQVTKVAAWTAVLADRTVVWANDAVSRTPLAGATVSLVGGDALATTDARGLAISATPASLKAEPPVGMLRIRSADGASVLLAFDIPSDPNAYPSTWVETGASAADPWWSLLYTDRSLYRKTDRIEAWGYARPRSGGSPPSAVELELVDPNAPDQALVSVRATPAPSGAYAVGLPFDRLPSGSYEVRARIDGAVVSSTWLEVGSIRKPAYQLELSADHLAVVAGTSVTITAKATFFDGSPVPGVKIRIQSDFAQPISETATDASGVVRVVATPPSSGASWGGPDLWGLNAAPIGPEEAEVVSPSLYVRVFASTDWLTQSSVVTAGRLDIAGGVHQAEVARVDRELLAGSVEADPAGAPIAGRSIAVTVVRHRSVRTQTGTYYDFTEKAVRPVYAYADEAVNMGTQSLVSAQDGSFHGSIPVGEAGDSYELRYASQDSAGRTAWLSGYAGSSATQWQDSVRFTTPSGKSPDAVSYAPGDAVTWRVVADGRPASAVPDRYLYLVTQRGLVDVSTTTSDAFERTFRTTDAPAIYVIAIPFVGGGYGSEVSAWAEMKLAPRSLSVRVRPDRPAYRPGEDAILTVSTTDAAGQPVAADVVLQAVDEKLVAMGAAWVPSPFALFRHTATGILRIASTHTSSTSLHGGGGGDTAGGGGVRDDFRDTLVSTIVATGADGMGRVTVHLSDDLTSWHVIGAAFTADVRSGIGELLVPVRLPLFADVTLADEYLASDRPVVRLRAYGTALQAGDTVTFTVSAPTLGLSETVIESKAFVETELALPALRVGAHELTVSVVSPRRLDGKGSPLRDQLIRVVRVVTSRLTTATAWYGSPSDPLPVVDSPDRATYTIADAGAGRYLPLLNEATSSTSNRADRAIARDLALKMLVERFGMAAESLPPADPDLESFGIVSDATEEGSSPGLALIRGGGADPWLAARVAALAPSHLSPVELEKALDAVLSSPDTRRDLAIATLAGLAAMGRDVEPELRAAAGAPDLTVTERLYLALAFLRIGDETSARTIERDLLRRYGQQLGQWTRIATDGTDAAAAETTALLAAVAAGVGDPLAQSMIGYVTRYPSSEASHLLELVVAAGLALDRLPRVTARVAYTVAGVRTEAEIAAGSSLRLVLTQQQRSTFRLEPLAGSVGVTVSWRRTTDTSTLRVDPNLSLSRTAPPVVATTGLVTVELTARISASAPANSCYEVVEQAPSGLAPILGGRSAPDDRVLWPTSIVGQEVRYCVGTEKAGPTSVTLRYMARVVNAGTFAWEPATIQNPEVATSVFVSEAGAVTIGATR